MNLVAGCLILELIHAILNLSPEEEDQGRSVQRRLFQSQDKYSIGPCDDVIHTHFFPS